MTSSQPQPSGSASYPVQPAPQGMPHYNPQQPHQQPPLQGGAYPPGSYPQPGGAYAVPVQPPHNPHVGQYDGYAQGYGPPTAPPPYTQAPALPSKM